MKKIINYFMGALTIIVILFIGGFTIGSVGIVPDNAIVYVDEKSNIYYSPLSLNQEKVTKLNLRKSTFKIAETLGYKMSEDDKQNGYFQQDGRSLSGMLFEKIGILPKIKSRVDAQGNWLY